MDDFDRNFKESLRALELLDFLGKLDKSKTELLVEFFDIKPEKKRAISVALEAKKENQKTLEKILK